jgi:phosphoribosylaminoimidazolecarboxamide formyltransferase / IMP cyclohydrolase
MVRIRRALISLSDKRGLVAFARGLQTFGIEILSTGGTYAALRNEDIPVRSVSDVTRFPEILDGRVKTLHPAIHAGILAVDDNPGHTQQLRDHNIDPIELIVVNLYPFEQTVARDGVSLEEAIENIDIGGPTMLRAAAKNYRHRAVVVNPDRYDALLEELRTNSGCVSDQTCWDLAREVFRHTAGYDNAIAQYLDTRDTPPGSLPPTLRVVMQKEYDLRYGENPHQHAAVYGHTGSLFNKLHGKELSYNNIVDMSAAAFLVAEFDEPTIGIVKHTNPCGVGCASTLAEAYEKAFATDASSPYGGIVAANRTIDLAAAERINQVFTEVIVAPGFDADALEFLRKKKDRRLVHLTADVRSQMQCDIRSVPGGFLAQEADLTPIQEEAFRVMTKRAPTEEETRALRFAWRVAKHVKSNAIVYTAADRTLGIGAGQMSRVDSAKLAAMKAQANGISLEGSVVGSDAFFPFADGLLETVRAGARAVIQPGGSIHDDEVIRAADDHTIAMVFTGIRHFRH